MLTIIISGSFWYFSTATGFLEHSQTAACTSGLANACSTECTRQLEDWRHVSLHAEHIWLLPSRDQYKYIRTQIVARAMPIRYLALPGQPVKLVVPSLASHMHRARTQAACQHHGCSRQVQACAPRASLSRSAVTGTSCLRQQMHLQKNMANVPWQSALSPVVCKAATRT